MLSRPQLVGAQSLAPGPTILQEIRDERKRSPRYQEAWGKGNKVNARDLLKGILSGTTTGVLGKTLGLQPQGKGRETNTTANSLALR